MFPFFFITDPVLIVAAIVPAAALLIYIYRLDRLEPEPPGLLLSLLFLGIISTALAKLSEEIGSLLAGAFFDERSRIYNLVLYFGVVGVSEEGFKYLLLKYRTWNSPDFNYQFDAIVYAVYVSLGFALWENISYVLLYGFSAALVRAVTAVPGHACFGVFMGAWYGLAKRCDYGGQPGLSKGFRWLAFLMPTLLHGYYDYVAVGASTTGSFVFFVALLFLAAFLVVRGASRRDKPV